MIQKLNHNGLGFFYFLCPVADFKKKVDALYDDRKGFPEFKTIWVSMWQWEISQQDKNGEPFHPVIYTPSISEAVDYLNSNAPEWQSKSNPDSKYYLICTAQPDPSEGQLDPLYNNLGNGIDCDYFFGFNSAQMTQVAEPVPSEI